jgi:hypothetical protein
MEGRLLLDVIIGEGTTILQLLAGKDQTLLVRGNTLLILDFLLDIVDGIRGLDLEGDGLTSKGLYEDLHRCCFLTIAIDLSEELSYIV